MDGVTFSFYMIFGAIIGGVGSAIIAWSATERYLHWGWILVDVVMAFLFLGVSCWMFCVPFYELQHLHSYLQRDYQAERALFSTAFALLLMGVVKLLSAFMAPALTSD